jgi:hypothetical protein
VPEDAGVLSGAQMWGGVKTAGKQEILGLQLSLLDSSLKRLPSCQRDFELHRALGLVLHDDGTRRHLISVTNIPDLQGDQIAAPKLAIDAQVEEGMRRRCLELGRRDFFYTQFHLQELHKSVHRPYERWDEARARARHGQFVRLELGLPKEAVQVAPRLAVLKQGSR